MKLVMGGGFLGLRGHYTDVNSGFRENFNSYVGWRLHLGFGNFIAIYLELWQWRKIRHLTELGGS